jgi:hypothetical protein
MAKLSSMFNDAQFILGIPAVGAKIFTYAAGSSTPLTTYTDEAGITPQSNPIILDARGEPPSPIWLTEGLAYKFVFTSSTDTDPPTSPIRTVDNVTGVGDNTVTISQWQDTGVSPTYIDADSFAVPGDQTSTFTFGRRVKASITAGTVYGYISSSVFGAGVTTVTVVLDSGTLDAGISSVQLGLITPDNTSLPLLSDEEWLLYNEADNTKTLKFDLSQIATGTERTASFQDKNGTVAYLSDVSSEAVKAFIPVRQTVLSGPVDNNGFSNFGGAGGSTTVTASGTLILTAANGFSATSPQDRVGSITNPSWTGLNVNGDMYLYLDINADGTCTPGASTLAPIYRRGGADVTTNGQFVFNIQQMVGKVGNGTVANQTYRVYVGEVNVVSNVVLLIKWYALMGRYESAPIPLPSAGTNITLTHNLGISSGIEVDCFATNLIAQNGYSVGSTVKPLAFYVVNSANIGGEPVSNKNKNQMDIQAGSNGTGWIQVNIGVGGGVSMTNANWNLVGTARRNW